MSWSNNTLLSYKDTLLRVRYNAGKSNGIDYGNGNLALVMGNQVIGGKIQRYWPGLDTKSLDRGVHLAVTIDYLEVLKDA